MNADTRDARGGARALLRITTFSGPSLTRAVTQLGFADHQLSGLGTEHIMQMRRGGWLRVWVTLIVLMSAARADGEIAGTLTFLSQSRSVHARGWTITPHPDGTETFTLSEETSIAHDFGVFDVTLVEPPDGGVLGKASQTSYFNQGGYTFYYLDQLSHSGYESHFGYGESSCDITFGLSDPATMNWSLAYNDTYGSITLDGTELSHFGGSRVLPAGEHALSLHDPLEGFGLGFSMQIQASAVIVPEPTLAFGFVAPIAAVTALRRSR